MIKSRNILHAVGKYFGDRGRSLKSISKNHQLFALAYFASLTVFLCRNMIFKPGIMLFEDYTPFFTFQQLIDYHTNVWNTYIQIPVVRSYDLFFMWARFVSTSKLAFILLVILSGLLLYLSCIEMLKIILDKKVVTTNHSLASIFASTFVLMVLLYTKLSHFYTLIIGMSIMALLISVFAKTLNELSYKCSTSKTKISLFLIAILLWVLPAPHFIMFFYVVCVSLALIYVICDKNGKLLLPLGFLVITHLIPYMVFLKLSLPVNLFEVAPYSYSLVVDGSVDPVVFFSSMQPGVMDRFLFWSYGPHVTLGFLVFSIALTIFGLTSVIYFRKSKIVMSLLILYLLSFFFSIGVKYPIGGYNLLIVLYDYPILGNIVETILQILRQPHRWQFIELYVKMILTSASAFIVLEKLGKRFESNVKVNLKRHIKNVSGKFLVVFCLTVLFFGSFLSSPYNILFSGDFGETLSPVKIPGGISAAKEIVSNVEGGKIIFLPAAREHQWGNRLVLNQEAFYIFYFDTPSIYWVFCATPENMLYNSFGYYLLLVNRSDVAKYYALQNIEWIFFSNDTLREFYVNENERILSALLSQEGFVLELSEGNYYLFRNEQYSNRSVVKSKSLTLALSPYYSPFVLLSEYNIFPEDTIFIDNLDGKIGFKEFAYLSGKLKENLIIRFPHKAPYDVYTIEDVVLSLLLKEEGVYVTPNMLLAGKQGWRTAAADWWKPYVDRYYAYYGATERKFILSNQKLSFDFKLDIPQTGYYSVYLKATAPKGADVAVKVGDKYENIINVPETFGNYKFVKLYEGSLTRGRYVVKMQKLDDKPIAINLIYAVEKHILEHYLQEFEKLIQENRNKIVHGYDELANTIFQLDYPENVTLLYSYDTIYSDLLIFKANSNYYKPVKCWYSGTCLIINGTVNEHEVSHQYRGGGLIYFSITMPILLSIAAILYWFRFENLVRKLMTEPLKRF